MAITGRRIELIISPQGEQTTHVIGATGISCRELSAPWEALAGAVMMTEDTIEAYESPEEVEIKTEQKK